MRENCTEGATKEERESHEQKDQRTFAVRKKKNRVNLKYVITK